MTGSVSPATARPSPCLRLGIDLGGTKIEGVVLDARGHELERLRIPTPRDDGYDAILDAIVGMVSGLEGRHGRGSVGVGAPGTISGKTGTIKNSNTQCLIGKPLDRDLEARLARPVRMANDANCFALAEAIDGAGAGHRVVFGVILGTGVGGGIVMDGRVHGGPNGIAGEWGHTCLVSEGHECYCGQRGCVETYLSGPGLERMYREAGGDALPGHEISPRAHDGDAAACAALERYLDLFGQGLATVVEVLDPDVIILGGGVGSVPELVDRGAECVARHLFSDDFVTPILRPHHGDSGGVRGAAMLWSLEELDAGQGSG